MWVPIEDYFCSHGFQNMMVKEKERMEEQKALGGKGRKKRKKESCTVGTGEWALSEVVHE